MLFFFYCGVLFCLQGGAEHRELKYSQFELNCVQDPTDSSKMMKCVIYSEFGSKNHQGLVHQVHLDNKIITHYADESLVTNVLLHCLSCTGQNYQMLQEREIYSIASPRRGFRRVMKCGTVITLLGIIFSPGN